MTAASFFFNKVEVEAKISNTLKQVTNKIDLKRWTLKLKFLN